MTPFRLTSRIALALALVSAAGCVNAPPPSICSVAADELVIFPANLERNVPTSSSIRVLSGAPADDLHVFVVNADGLEVAGSETLFKTNFGDVVEWVADSPFGLEPNAPYTIELEDRGLLAVESQFSTNDDDAFDVTPVRGSVQLRALLGEERSCCSGDQCADGTAVIFPALPDDHVSPQLGLLTVDEVRNTRCGPEVIGVGVIPVVLFGESDEDAQAVAETDLLLDGCYDIALVTQTLQNYPLGDTVCADGEPFVAAVPAADCAPVSGGGGGCACEAATPSAAPAVGMLLVLLSLIGLRTRASHSRQVRRSSHVALKD